MPEEVKLTVAFSSETTDRLEALAEKTQRTKESHIRQAILDYLEEWDEYSSIQEVLERVRRGEEKMYSLEEVAREIGLKK